MAKSSSQAAQALQLADTAAMASLIRDRGDSTAAMWKTSCSQSAIKEQNSL